MNNTAIRRIGAVVGAAAVITTMTTTAPASAGQRDTTKDRPCFMIRSHWNNAEGPQPTCPKGRFEKAQPAPSSRVADFMP